MYFYVASGIVILIVLSTANLIDYVCIPESFNRLLAYKKIFLLLITFVN